MTEQNTTANTQAPESVTGLAITVGSLRSDLHHHIEDNARSINELRRLVREETAVREIAISDLETRLNELMGLVQQAVDVMAEYAKSNPPAPAEPQAQAEGEPATPPERKRGETSKALYVRLVKWAEDHKAEAPPKPNGGMFGTGYDRALQPWREKIGA